MRGVKLNARILVTGAAGLLGQNLLAQLSSRGYTHITAMDKSAHNLAILSELHPNVRAIHADLATVGPWQAELANQDVVFLLHAQIGGLEEVAFTRNNIEATEQLLRGLPRECHVIHVSSSVVNSQADDFYTRSKFAQEKLVRESGLPHCILRPTLMFGWFDRKHFGWLSRFMQRVPVFPVPGHGRYLRQPLYAADFCRVLLACLEQRVVGKAYNISGKERVFYVDIVRQIKSTVGAKAAVLSIPTWLFRALLKTYALFDQDPPFTVKQLEALVIDEVFEDIDWEALFSVQATPLNQALRETFTDERYAHITLEF